MRNSTLGLLAIGIALAAPFAFQCTLEAHDQHQKPVFHGVGGLGGAGRRAAIGTVPGGTTTPVSFATPIAMSDPFMVSGPMHLIDDNPFAIPEVMGARKIITGDIPTTVIEPLVKEYAWPQDASTNDEYQPAPRGKSMSLKQHHSRWHTKHGQVSDLPGDSGTQTDAVLPTNAFIQGITNSQPVASQETQVRNMENNDVSVPRYITGSSGHLVPKVLATRLLLGDDNSISVGGPVISELPDRGRAEHAPTRTMARVFTTKRQAKKSTHFHHIKDFSRRSFGPTIKSTNHSG